MAIPEGYTELGRIGFVDKGNYSASATYRIGDTVYYNGSTWVALKDNLKGVTPANGTNWKYLARGFAAELLSAIMATDASGLVGTANAQVNAQTLLNVIADKVATKLLLKSDVVSQIINDASKAASMAAVYALSQKIGDTAQLPEGTGDLVSAFTGLDTKLSKLSYNNDNLECRFFTLQTDNQGFARLSWLPGDTIFSACTVSPDSYISKIFCNQSGDSQFVEIRKASDGSILTNYAVNVVCLIA